MDSATSTLIISIVSVLAASGIIGTIIAICNDNRQKKRQFKLDLLSELFGQKVQLSKDSKNKDELNIALNKVPIVFSSDKKAIESFKEFKNDLRSPDRINNAYIKLLKALCKSVKLDYKEFDDTLIEETINVK